MPDNVQVCRLLIWPGFCGFETIRKPATKMKLYITNALINYNVGVHCFGFLLLEGENKESVSFVLIVEMPLSRCSSAN